MASTLLIFQSKRFKGERLRCWYFLAGGNEAEIFIIAILRRENNCLAILGEELSLHILRGEEILVHERLGDVFLGEMYIFREEGGNVIRNFGG